MLNLKSEIGTVMKKWTHERSIQLLRTVREMMLVQHSTGSHDLKGQCRDDGSIIWEKSLFATETLKREHLCSWWGEVLVPICCWWDWNSYDTQRKINFLRVGMGE